MAWQPDPFLLVFLEAVEQELAWALEVHHRRRASGPLEARAPVGESESIAALRRTVDAVQAALDRPENAIFH